MEFSAGLYDGESAARHEVRVRATAEGLWIAERGELWRWGELKAREEAALRVERGAAVLVVGSAEMGAARRAMQPHVRVDRVGGHGPAFLAAVFLAGAMLLWTGYRYALPWAGEKAAAVAPRAWEENLGESAAQSLLAGERVVGKGRAVEAVDRVLRRLEEAEPAGGYDFRVSIVESPLVNAGALPGGRIFVYSGLLKKCATADEFAAVLAHEMSHVERRHGMKSLGRQAALSLAMALLGSPDSLGAVLGSQMAGLKYQRGDEDEADADGLRRMAHAGFDPRAAARFFEKMNEEGVRVPEYFSTHPDPAGRAKRLREMAEGMGAAARPVTSEAPWRAAVEELP